MLYPEIDVYLSDRDSLCSSMSRLLSGSVPPDAVLVCDGGRRLPCHRLVLAARSDVFRAMFFDHPDTSEALTGAVRVREADPAALGEFLAFLYRGSCAPDKFGRPADEEVDMLGRLLALADRYLVPDLEAACHGRLAELQAVPGTTEEGTAS